MTAFPEYVHMTFAEREGGDGYEKAWTSLEDKNASRKETERYGDKIVLLEVTYSHSQHRVLLCKKPE